MTRPFAQAANARLAEAFRQLNAGMPAAAEAIARQVLTEFPGHPTGLLLLALALSALRKATDALPIYQQLTVLEPGLATHWSNLGNCLCELGREAEARDPLMRARTLGADDDAVHFGLARVYSSLGPASVGLEHIDQAIAQAPQDIEYRLLRAKLLTGMDDWERANDEVEQLLQQPLDTALRADLAYLMLRNGLYTQARQLFTTVLTEDAANPDAQLGMVMVLERVNEVDEARQRFHLLESRLSESEALRLREKLLQVQASLAARAGDPARARDCLQTLLDDFPLDPALRVNLSFDLGAALVKLAAPADAMQAFAKGHAERRAMVNNDHPSLVRADGLFSVLDEPTVVPRRLAFEPTRDTHKDPVFVVGFPRSGTTLLEQLLDAHGELASFDEQPFLQRIVKRLCVGGRSVQQAIDALDADQVSQQRTCYFDDITRVLPDLGTRRPVDKNPLNLIRLPLIQDFFPDTRVILAIRHPCDVVLSCYMQSFRAPAFAVTFETLDSCADMYDRVFSSWWQARDNFSLPVLQLRYEDLVADTEREARKLFAFLGLDWHPELLEFTERAKRKGAISTPSYTQVIEKVNSKAVGRWQAYREYFSATALARLAPWIETFGYPAIDR
jgi:tetratricopeptide (TPR) repeat protein